MLSKIKDLVFIGITVVGAIFGWIAYNNMQQQLEQHTIAYKQLSDTLARSQTEYATKADLKKTANALSVDLGIIENDLSSVNAYLKAIGSVTSELKETLTTNIVSHAEPTHEPPIQPAACMLCDLYKYTLAVQWVDVEFLKTPVARVWFDASKPTPWTIQTDNIQTTAATVIGEQKTGGELVFYSEITLINNTRNIQTKLPVIKSFYQQIPRQKQFFWVAPSVDIGLSGGLMLGDSATPRFGGLLEFSLMGYGYTKKELDWRFLGLGGGYNGAWFAAFTPVKYNFGQHIPFFTNIWIGLDVLYTNQFGIGLSLTGRL